MFDEIVTLSKKSSEPKIGLSFQLPVSTKIKFGVACKKSGLSMASALAVMAELFTSGYEKKIQRKKNVYI